MRNKFIIISALIALVLVNPFEAAAKKISNMLDVLLEQKPRLYGKTKARYNDLKEMTTK